MRLLLLLASLWLLPLAAAEDDEDCSIWLAPSTIPGAGLGMYAGHSFEVQQVIPSPDVVLPFVDLQYHVDQNNNLQFPKLHELLKDYRWNGAAFSTAGNEGMKTVEVLVPGLGAAVNSYLPLENIRGDPSTPNHDLNLHRGVHPAAGAISPFPNRTYRATVAIEEGQELFQYYGATWHEARAHLYGPPPKGYALSRATDLLHKLQSIKAAPMETLSEVWSGFVLDSAFAATSDSVIFRQALNRSGPVERNISQFTSYVELRRRQATRSVDWLQAHGTCADNLESKPSTLNGAGRGAFAKRRLTQGSVVSHLPLIHIPDRNILTMYNYHPRNNLPHAKLGVKGQQLLLNYCLGHAESTLLLCPYAPGFGFVNHNQTLANVQLQWPSSTSMGNHKPELLNWTVQELYEQVGSASLGMELVALRDIEPGEEVFLDYGDEWQEAWQRHVRSWRPVQGAHVYRNEVQLNNIQPRLPTEFEALQRDPHRSNTAVELWCHKRFEGNGWKTWSPTLLYGRPDDPSYYAPTRNTRLYVKCDLLRYELDSNLTRIHTPGGDGYLYHTIMYKEPIPGHYVAAGRLEGVPRLALEYRDKPMTSDMHLPNAFRHDIRVPDHLFPASWRNLKAKAAAKNDNKSK